MFIVSNLRQNIGRERKGPKVSNLGQNLLLQTAPEMSGSSFTFNVCSTFRFAENTHSLLEIGPL